MDDHGDAHMEVREGSNSNTKILIDNDQRLISVPAMRESLALILLKCVETGSYQMVKEEFKNLNFPKMVWMGHLVAEANLHNNVNLTKELKKSMLQLKAMLPAAKLKIQAGNLEVRSMKIGKEAIHVATRLCYHIYIIWHLLVIAICRDDDLKDEQRLIFHEILLLHNEHNMLTSEAETTAVGYDNPDVKQLMESRSLIDNKFLQLVMNELAKRHQDKMLYDLGQMMRVTVNNKAVDNANESTLWPCSAESHFGRWVIKMAKALLHMDIEGSYQHTNEKRLDYIQCSLHEVVSFTAKLESKVIIQHGYIDLMVSISQVHVCIHNNVVSEGKRTGHFPSQVYLSVVPVNDGLTGVTTRGSSRNTSMKVGVTENVQGGANVNSRPSAGFNFSASKTIASEVEVKPWQLHQLIEDNGRGSSLTWELESLDGNKFNRRNPLNGQVKRSIWQFGNRTPTNPAQELPFASDGSVNFTAEEFSNVMEWRYPIELENKDVLFNIVGRVSTTCTQAPFWETRIMPFECQLKQNLKAEAKLSQTRRRRRNQARSLPPSL
ncbi:unnamed protein product [Sphagnum balticum]